MTLVSPVTAHFLFPAVSLPQLMGTLVFSKLLISLLSRQCQLACFPQRSFSRAFRVASPGHRCLVPRQLLPCCGEPGLPHVLSGRGAPKHCQFLSSICSDLFP